MLMSLLFLASLVSAGVVAVLGWELALCWLRLRPCLGCWNREERERRRKVGTGG